MNCFEFKKNFDARAHHEALDQAPHARLHEHAAACAHCAAHLADAQVLQRGLRALATADAATKDAPAHIEATLLDAFRQHAKANVQVSMTSASNAAARRPRRANRVKLEVTAFAKRPMVAATTSAALLALVMLTALSPWLARRQSIQTRTTQQSAHDGRLRLENAASLTKPNASIEQSRAANLPSPDQAVTTSRNRLTDEKAFASDALLSHHEMNSVPQTSASPRRLSETYGNSKRAANNVHAASTRALRDATSADSDIDNSNEIATDFIALTHDDGLTELDSGSLVRVELPRSALVKFGLPMNAERDSEPVSADVLLGEDGLARAIRFVR